MTFGAAADESRAQTWARRCVTIPGFLLGWALALVALPFALLAAVVFDLLTNRRFPVTRTVVMVMVYLTAEAAGILAAGWLWARQAAMREREDIYLDRVYRLQRWWAMTLYHAVRRIYGLRVHIDDQELANLGQCIVFVRHVCIFDNLVPYVAATDRHGVRMRWAINRSLLRDPCLDIVGSRLPNAFVRNGREDSEREVARVVRLLDGLGPREGIQIFPEGGLYSPERRARLIERLEAKGARELLGRARRLQHTLPPRLGGSLGVLEANTGADAVFIAHTGLEAAGSYRRILAGGLVGREVRIRAWRVPYEGIPREREALASWFAEQWERVDAFVEAVETGTPVIAGTPETVG